MNLLWRLIDPLLLAFRSRLEHLEAHRPSKRREVLLRACARVDSTTRLGPDARLYAPTPDHLTIGAHCLLLGEILLLNPVSRCTIGHHCSLGHGSRIWVQDEVTIGHHVLIAHYVDIHDNNSHSLDWRDRRNDGVTVLERREKLDTSRVASAPVRIEDDVWIGAKSTILKGVTIGRGAVVAAASVVTRDVEPFTLVAGNPARVVRRLPA